MIWFVFVSLFAYDNTEFFEMVEERQAQGHSWYWVGRTEVTDNFIALPVGEDPQVFYWEIKDE